MKNVQIRDVPDDIHALLTQRAAAEEKSLQVYLSELLTREAKKQETEIFLRSISSTKRRNRYSMQDAVDIIRADRETR